MAFEKSDNDLSGLWLKTGQKGDYMTGTINGEKVVCFPVKSDNPNAPTWRVLRSVKNEDRPQSKLDAQEAPRRDSRVDDIDVPF